MFGISKSFMESSLSMKYLDDIQKWLFLNTGAYKEGFWSAIQSAYSFIQVIGFALIATFFLKALLTESAKENLTIETLGKMMIGLVLALAVITHIPEITNAFLKISENAAGAILSDETLIKDGESAITTAVEAWKKETPNPIAFFHKPEQQSCFFRVGEMRYCFMFCIKSVLSPLTLQSFPEPLILAGV